MTYACALAQTAPLLSRHLVIRQWRFPLPARQSTLRNGQMQVHAASDDFLRACLGEGVRFLSIRLLLRPSVVVQS